MVTLLYLIFIVKELKQRFLMKTGKKQMAADAMPSAFHILFHLLIGARGIFALALRVCY
jgi:hypothetical protein